MTHLIIKKFLNSMGLNSQFLDDHSSDNEVINGIKTLGKVWSYSADELDAILEKVITINLNDSPSIDVSILFLFFISHYHYTCIFRKPLVNSIHIQEAKRSIGNATDFLSNKTEPTLKAAIHLLHSAIANAYSDFELANKLDKKALALLKYKNLFDIQITNSILRNHATLGILRKVKELDTIKGAYKKHQQENSFTLIEFCDATARGDTILARAKLNTLQKVNDQTIKCILGQDHLRKHYLQCNMWDKNNWTFVLNDLRDDSSSRFYKALHSKDAEAALKVSQEIVKESETKISSYEEILMAELCNRNLEASEMIYQKHSAEFSNHYFNHFYQMRIELLKNNYLRAAKHYKDLIKGAKENDSFGMVTFALSLALEVTPLDMHNMNYHEHFDVTSQPTNPLADKRNSTSHKKEGLIIGESIAIQQVRNDITRYADLAIPVLITGETGVGKEIVAKELHTQSSRAKEKFIAINCGAINHTLLQSELFGHCQGAFTGAHKYKKGIFEVAGKGTVLLDEFGETSQLLQVALLRVLQENEIRPIGSTEVKSIECRILIATNKNLKKLVDEEKFRKDLYYRINRIEINIPPLRERAIDILPLAKHFLSSSLPNNQEIQLSYDLKEALSQHHWAGNIRELKNKTELMSILSSDKTSYTLHDFPISKNTTNHQIKESKSSLTQKEIDLKALKELTQTKSSTDKRILRIKEIFQSGNRIQRTQLVKILGVAPKTITNDIKNLLSDNFIEKVEPTPSPRSHYFILKS